MTFDMSQLRLDTSVPQAYLGQTARGYVSPEYWDAGVPAALLNYNFNSYHSDSQGQSQTTSYLGLNMGLNLGPWHLRENGTLTWESATTNAPSRRKWQSIQTYVQRDLPSLRSQLTIGDSYTDGAVFDSYGIRGVQLGTDDRMLPQSLQGYAPARTRRGPDQRPGRGAPERRADLPGYGRARPVHDQRSVPDRLWRQPGSDGDRSGWPHEHVHRAVCLGGAIAAPGHHPLRHRRR